MCECIINVIRLSVSKWIIAIHHLLVSYNLLNHFFCFLKFFIRSFHKNISHSSFIYFFFCDLNFGSTFQLKLLNCFTIFANNKTHTIIRNRYDISISRGWSIRCHHSIINFFIIYAYLPINILNSLTLVFVCLRIITVLSNLRFLFLQ